MKRIVAAAAALLCLALPASAARVALVRTASGHTATDIAVALDLANWRAALDLMGCDYDVLTQHAVTDGGTTTAMYALKRGIVNLGGPGSGTKSYGLFIHQNFARNISGANNIPKYNPDSLTLAAGWSAVPQIFGTPLRIFAGSVLNNQANVCSTGVSASLNLLTSNPSGISARMVGTPYTWDAPTGGNFYYRSDAGLALNRTDPMIQRARVIVGVNATFVNDVSNAWPGVVTPGTAGNFAATNPDSMANPSSQFASPGADTAVIWTRERRFTASTNKSLVGYRGVDPAPNIFVCGTYVGNGTVSTDIAEKCMAIAIADSASGGVLIGQKRGWTQKRLAVVINGAFSYTDGSASTDTYDNVGIMNRDSTFAKAGMDSLKALGVPMMVTVNIDSVETYQNQKAWWFGWPNTTYSPESRTRASGNGKTSPPGNQDGSTDASSTSAVDPFGMWRSRSLAEYGRLVNNEDCASNDTTVSCLVKSMRTRLSAYTSKLSRTLMATHFDYIPANYTRASQRSQDSLALALIRSGYDGAIQGVSPIGSSGISFGINSAGTLFDPDPWNPSQYSPSERSIIVRDPILSGSGQSQVTNRFRWLTTREIDEAASAGLNTTHQFAAEQWTGITNNGWYYPLARYNHYVHSFQTTCSVFLLRANDLGYTTNATSNPTRRGYTILRRNVYKVRAINAMKWQGTQPAILFVQPDDITPP